MKSVSFDQLADERIAQIKDKIKNGMSALDAIDAHTVGQPPAIGSGEVCNDDGDCPAHGDTPASISIDKMFDEIERRRAKKDRA
jgi:hypothetical protein